MGYVHPFSNVALQTDIQQNKDFNVLIFRVGSCPPSLQTDIQQNKDFNLCRTTS
mgnify:CR=1 FL=1